MESQPRVTQHELFTSIYTVTHNAIRLSRTQSPLFTCRGNINFCIFRSTQSPEITFSPCKQAPLTEDINFIFSTHYFKLWKMCYCLYFVIHGSCSWYFSTTNPEWIKSQVRCPSEQKLKDIYISVPAVWNISESFKSN